MIKRGLLWSALIGAAMLAVSAYGWAVLPGDAQFPMHWSASGDVNRYGGKLEALFLVPVMTVFVVLVLAVAPLVDPRRENLQQSSTFYLAGWIGGVGVLALAHVVIVYAAVTGKAPPIAALMLCVGGFIAILGNFMAKSRSNWFAGIRTPWTLSSDHAWSVANRLSGWGFVITGLLTMVLVLLSTTENAIAGLLTGLIASLIAGTVTSYFAWRNDPDRRVS